MTSVEWTAVEHMRLRANYKIRTMKTNGSLEQIDEYLIDTAFMLFSSYEQLIYRIFRNGEKIR